VGPSVVVCGEIGDASASSCLLHKGADGVEGGGEVVKDLVECSARVFDGEGDKFYPSPRSSRSPRTNLHNLVVTAEISTKPVLHEDEGALYLVGRGRVWGGGLGDPPCINEFRRSAMTGGGEQLLCLF
jgi:hypothetical protein